MAKLTLVNSFEGTIDWDGVSDSFTNISADARNQLGLQGDETNEIIQLDEAEAQMFFVSGGTLKFDTEITNQ